MNNLHVSKKGIKTHFSYNWWVYVVLPVLAISVIFYSFYLKDRLKANEQITIFTEINIADKREIRKGLLDELKDDGILKINFTDAAGANEMKYTLLEAQGFSLSDILIFSESTFNDSIIANLVQFDDDFVNQIKAKNEHVEIYQTLNSHSYGVKIFDFDDKEYNEKFNFSSWLNFDNLEENYYMVLNSKSRNVGKFSTHKKAKDENVAAFKAFTYLLGEK